MVNQCRNCGAPVSRRFCRVFGTNEDEVYACSSCANWTALLDGAGATGEEVPAATGTSLEQPDRPERREGR